MIVNEHLIALDPPSVTAHNYCMETRCTTLDLLERLFDELPIQSENYGARIEVQLVDCKMSLLTKCTQLRLWACIHLLYATKEYLVFILQVFKI